MFYIVFKNNNYYTKYTHIIIITDGYIVFEKYGGGNKFAVLITGEWTGLYSTHVRSIFTETCTISADFKYKL